MNTPTSTAAPPPKPSLIAATGQALTLFELRSYQARPGRRDALIALFESEFLDAYEANGATILGTFRALDDPDRWVWIRAFANGVERGKALEGFYASPTWQRLAKAANATIARSSNARLLRLHEGQVPFVASEVHSDASAATILLEIIAKPEAANAFEAKAADADQKHALLAQHRAQPVLSFVTDHSENHFPRQRIRPEPVTVTLLRFEAWSDHAAYRAERSKGDTHELLRLEPTPRSRIRK